MSLQSGGDDVVMWAVCYWQCGWICVTILGQLGSSASLVRFGVNYLLVRGKRSQVVHPCPSLRRRRCLYGVDREVMCSALAAELEFDVETPCIGHPSQLAAGDYERSCRPVCVVAGARSAVWVQFRVAGLAVGVFCDVQCGGLGSDGACGNENVGGGEACLPLYCVGGVGMSAIRWRELGRSVTGAGWWLGRGCSVLERLQCVAGGGRSGGRRVLWLHCSR